MGNENFEKLMVCLRLLEQYRSYGYGCEAAVKRFNAQELFFIDTLLVFRFTELPKEFFELEGQDLIDFIIKFVESGRIKGGSLDDTAKSVA